MRRIVGGALLALSLCLVPGAHAEGPDPETVVGPPSGPPLSGDELEAKTREVASHLRCPVCQGLSVADSPSESARAMKDEARGLVAKGFDQEQILDYFESSYGEFIRLEPKAEGWNLLVWAAPGAALLVGGALVWGTVRSWKGKAPAGVTGGTAGEAGASAKRVELVDPPELAPYLEKVRAVVGRADA